MRGLIAAAPGSDSTLAMGMGASDGYTSVWQLPTGKRKLQIRSSDAPMSLAFSHDSQNLAVGYRDGSAELWNLDAGELLFRWKEHSGSISMLSFSRDGSKIISQSRNLQFLRLAALRRELAALHLNW
jgi:WD40 repeat protein